jgi:hypothetical protein
LDRPDLPARNSARLPVADADGEFPGWWRVGECHRLRAICWKAAIHRVRAATDEARYDAEAYLAYCRLTDEVLAAARGGTD